MSKEKDAFLAAIRVSESSLDSSAYNTIFGGERFSDFSKHPNKCVKIPWRSGLCSSAAGAYQITGTTWRDLQRKYPNRFTDFSPEKQDDAAWVLATTRYRAMTGRDLEQDLRNKGFDSVARVLSKTWTSLVGGSEKNSNTGKAKSVYDRVLAGENLAKKP